MGGSASSGGGQGGQGGMLPPGTCIKSTDCTMLNDTCNTGTCIEGKCVRLLAHQGDPCDDGLFCTDNDTCQAGGEENGFPIGACKGGGPKNCAPPSTCQIGLCDEDNDTCNPLPANENQTCDDGDPCTLDGVCANGACVNAAPKNCSIFDSECATGACDPVVGCKPMPKNEGMSCTLGTTNPCATGQCIQGQCKAVPINVGTPCNDGLYCTINDHCDNAQCVGDPRPCPTPSSCYVSSCDELNDKCVVTTGNEGQPCDDSNSCTANTVCQSGACKGGMSTNEGATCDDRAYCTMGELCSAGACGAAGGTKIYFADDFRDSAKGWFLGNEWQIGPATASPPGFGSTTDPATDHSPTNDNGVAGVVLGGNASTLVHAFSYLESPSFDTSGATGPVVLSFYRWLNSDSTPYMTNIIEVYNGSTWIKVWQSGATGIYDSPPNGPGWGFYQFDVTAQKSANMRVRFGFNVGTSGSNIVGSWNIDDVVIASAACP